MILPLPLQRALDRHLPWVAERPILLKAMSFGLIGVVNAAVDASVFFLTLAWATSSLVAANVTAWFVAVSCSYVMNSRITFAAESGRQFRFADYLRFVASGLAGVVANTAVLLLAAQHASIWIAKGLAILASFVVNFTLSHFVVFRVRSDE
jgi:putative flippase GtrA